MFKVNDVIVYGTQGVFQIADMEEKTVNGVKKNYFVLKPVGDNGATVFAPADNAQIRKKMRYLLTKDEIHRLIAAMPDEDAVWIANDNARKEHYKGILARGDHLELIRMIKAIYGHKKEREAEGKRLHLSDEHFFREAEQLLYKEFAYVLKLNNKEELMKYIFLHIEKQ